jgi:hypothetical protein
VGRETCASFPPPPPTQTHKLVLLLSLEKKKRKERIPSLSSHERASTKIYY